MDDILQVISRKIEDWENDEKMCKFLRPSTLFRKSNFENYINEKKPKKKEGEFREIQYKGLHK